MMLRNIRITKILQFALCTSIDWHYSYHVPLFVRPTHYVRDNCILCLIHFTLAKLCINNFFPRSDRFIDMRCMLWDDEREYATASLLMPFSEYMHDVARWGGYGFRERVWWGG